MDRRIVFATVSLLVVCSSGFAYAQPFPIPPPIFQPQAAIYAVKFLCGFEQPPIFTPPVQFPREPQVKPGNYTTAVNILNFHNHSVKICKKAVVALPESCSEDKQPPGTNCNQFIGINNRVVLTPDQAMEIDCDDIVNLFGGTFPGVPPGLPPFIKGFVEIVVPAQDRLSLNNPLGVTGVYTAQQCLAASPGDVSCKTLFPGGIEVEPQTSQLSELPSYCGGG